MKVRRPSHHVPGEVGQPVEQRLHAADELHVLGCTDALLDEEDHKASRDEGHGKDHADGHQHVHGGGDPGDRPAGQTRLVPLALEDKSELIQPLPGSVSDGPIRTKRAEIFTLKPLLGKTFTLEKKSTIITTTQKDSLLGKVLLSSE